MLANLPAWMPAFIPVVLLVVSSAIAQTVPNERLTFSGGWSREFGGSSFSQKRTATGLGLSYGYRVRSFVEAEAGVFTALDPTGSQCDHNGCVDVQDRFLWIPFGVRFVTPPSLGRFEFSGGGGGLYEKYTAGNTLSCCGPDSRNGWGGYFVGSAAVALDHSRHYWLGVTPRWFLANPAFARDRWFQFTGEFSVRFR